MTQRVERWGVRPGGRHATHVSYDLINAIRDLIKQHGPEAVAQVAVRGSGFEPFTPDGH